MSPDLAADLRRQAAAEDRNYDGHNRRPMRTTMRDVARRRSRRRWRAILRKMAL